MYVYIYMYIYIYINLQHWWLLHVVSIYRTCQWTAAVRLDIMQKPKNPNFSTFLINEFSQPARVQTDFNQERQYAYNATL